jgi:radical SAM protein with 4Fe4S-binding SPASM domain
MKAKELLEQKHVEYNILCVLTNELAKEPELPKICGSCKYLKACQGGYKRMRDIMYADSGGSGLRL